MTSDLVFVLVCAYLAWYVVELACSIKAIGRWLCRHFDHAWTYRDYKQLSGTHYRYRSCTRCEPIQRVEMFNDLTATARGWIHALTQ